MKGGSLVPIYIMGEGDEDASTNRAFESGASDYLIKPVNMAVLSRRISRDLSILARVDASGAGSLEKAQVESELFRHIPEPSLLVNPKGVILTANEAFERVFARRHTVAGGLMKDLLNGVDRATFEKELVAYADLNCVGRGRVPVRVHHVNLLGGPWRGCSVFFISERSQNDTAANLALNPAQRANIIILEDYDVVARSIRRLLEKAGHRVSVAASANEAIAQFTSAIERKESFDLAILDLSIPGSAGGADVIKTLRNIMPELPAIVMSGAWTDPAMARPSAFGFDAALRKPFSRDELLDVTNRVLALRKK